jgi:hypothetical protein
MKLKFKVMFKNGKTKSYKTTSMSNSECEDRKDYFQSFFKEMFKENVDGNFVVKDSIIRCSDISSVKISYTL